MKTHGEDKLKDFLHHICAIHSSFRFTCNYSKECVQFLDVSVYVDCTLIIATDMYAKTTDTHQYLLTNSHENKRSMPYGKALRIPRIFSNIETAISRCRELVSSLDKRDYNKRKTNIHKERDFTNLANH